MENKTKIIQAVKTGLLLTGSFCIALLAAELLHELCHAAAALLTGGFLGKIVIDPFSWSHTYSSSPNHPIIFIAAGAIGSSIIALMLYIILVRWPNPIMLPLLLIGPVSMLDNGLYWIVDTIAGSGMDACNLIYFGLSAPTVLLTGSLLFVIGILLAIHLMRTIGVTNETFSIRLIILSIGILPESIARLTWNWFCSHEGFNLWLIYSSSTVALIVFIVVFCKFFKTKKYKQFSPSWPTVIGFNLFAIAVIIVLSVTASGAQPDFTSKLNISETRPEGFPIALTPHPLATEISYVENPILKFDHVNALLYHLPESTYPDEIQNYLTQLHTKHGYFKLDYHLSDPNKPLSDGWQQDISKVGLVTVRIETLKQIWLRLSPDVSSLLIHVSYIWREDKFQSSLCMNSYEKIQQFDDVFKYASVHPDVFDPNQHQLLKLLRTTPPQKVESE
jgi:hypothetical protein